VPTMFTVFTPATDEDDIEVFCEIEAPSLKRTPKVKPIGGGKFEVHYTPSEPGDHKIHVTVDGNPVPGSAFTVPVKPNYAKKVIATGPGLVNATAGRETQFIVQNAPDESVAKTVCTVTGPDGDVPCKMAPNGAGKYHCTYTPRVAGDHKVSIQTDGIEIPNGPYCCAVKENYAPKTIVKGLDPSAEFLGMVASTFDVIAPVKNAGVLTVEVEGPNTKETPTVTDNKDGTWGVLFTPSTPGDYKVIVKLDDEHVPGSPFSIKVRRATDDELIENAAKDPRTCHCQPPEPNMFDKRFCRACQKWVFDYYMHVCGVTKMEGIKDSNKFKQRD